jgi:DNA-binding transcriptional MerR regulator
MRVNKRAAGRGLSIEELAEKSGVSVRSIRNYQHKGLLMGPNVVGRVGLYSTAHLKRLRSITQLLETDYSLSSIAHLFAALDRGISLKLLLAVGGDPSRVDDSAEG